MDENESETELEKRRISSDDDSDVSQKSSDEQCCSRMTTAIRAKVRVVETNQIRTK